MKNLYISLLLLLALSVQGVAQVSEQEFQALKAIYNATGGDNWKNRTGWENINTSATKNDVTTAWFGISEIIDGHITEFNLGSNNLSGELPAAIGNFKWMKYLSVPNNKITGAIPTEIGNLINLEELSLSGNMISSPLPASMSNLTKLETIHISSNPLNSPFPNDIIKNWPKLYNFQAHNCGFSGAIDVDFEIFPALYIFRVSSNQLTGDIPHTISRLKKLYTIDFNHNNLTGNLPSLDSCASSIKEINFSENQFTGQVSQTYNNFSRTNIVFFIYDNHLSGQLPIDFILNKTTLRDCSNNFFTFAALETVVQKVIADKWSFMTNKLFPLKSNAISINKGEPLSLNATELSEHNLGGNNNRYKWFKDNIEVYSGNSPIYTIASSANSNAGVYRFEVTNTVVANITLKSENITVSIIGGNETPTDILLSSNTINENYTGNVGVLSAIDPDAGDTHTFSFTSGNGTNDKDNKIFEIDSNTLRIKNEVDYEKNTTLNILLLTNDGNGGIFTKALVINVNNVNEAPTFNNQTKTASIDENAANGTLVFTLTATDSEGSAVTYSIAHGNDNAAFSINGSKLVVADNTKLSYDTKKSYTLGIVASDGELSSPIDLTVNLNKINAMPLVENAVFSIDENSANATVVGTITANDPEGSPLTITITGGNTSNAFAISAKNVTVANAAALDYETNKVFNLAINVSDGISNVPATITINLANKIDETGNDIVAFSVTGMVNATINTTNRTISAVISKTDITALATTLSVSKGAVANKESGATLNFLTPQTIVVTSETGTTKTWTATVTYAVDVDEVRTKYLRVYPNPAKEFLTITGLSNGEIIQIVDLKGNVLMQHFATSEATKLNIGAMQKGFYILALKNGTTTRSTKLVID